MTGSASEPSTAFWAAGIAVSLAVHGGLVGGAALFAGRLAQASAPTEITFSGEASPSAEAVASAAAPAVASEAATAVAAERVEPSPSAPSTAEKAETVQPAEAVAAATPELAAASESTEAATSSQVAEAAAATTPEPAAVPESTEAASTPQIAEAVAAAQTAERVDRSSSPDAAAVAAGETSETVTAQERPAAAVAAERAPAETSAGVAAAESASAIAAQDVAKAGAERTEQLVALQTPEALSVAPESSVQTAVATAPETVQPRTSPTSSADVASAAAETVRPQAPAAGSAAVAVVGSGGAETVAPAASSSEVVTAVATDAVQPSGGSAESVGSAAPVVSGGQETAETVRPLETALLVPARPNSVLGTEVDKPTDRYRRIVDFIRGYRGGDCFIALPAMDLGGTVTFQTFGRDKAREDEFREALTAIDELKTEISSGDVADPQCLALAFAQAARRYPGFSLVIDLNETEMASGTQLSGSVLNAEGRDLHLMLVDDEGQVQSIDGFLSEQAGADRAFSVPLTLTGGKPVATKQIVLAIATEPPLPGLDQVNEPAAAFFRRLARQIDETSADVDLAVEGFNVR